MLKIKFANGKEIEYLEAIETEEYFNGASRRTLTVECEPTAIGIDELNTILSNEENLTEVIMKNIDEKGVLEVSVDELNTTLSNEENLSEVVMKNIDEKGVLEVSVDELNTTLSNEENLSEVVMKNIDEKGVLTAENIYGGYVLKLELAIKQKLVDPKTNNYGDKLVFKIGKRTYIEEQLKKLGL